jgi:hypothetical protein
MHLNLMENLYNRRRLTGRKSSQRVHDGEPNSVLLRTLEFHAPRTLGPLTAGSNPDWGTNRSGWEGRRAGRRIPLDTRRTKPWISRTRSLGRREYLYASIPDRSEGNATSPLNKISTRPRPKRPQNQPTSNQTFWRARISVVSRKSPEAFNPPKSSGVPSAIAASTSEALRCIS